MTTLSDPPRTASSYADSDESLPPLVPLLRRILAASDASFQDDLSERGQMTEEVLRRALFPVTRVFSYLNHAAVGPVPAPVAWATREAYELLSLRGSLGMEGALPEDGVRTRFARLINVAPEGVAFTKNVSDSFVTIAQGIPWRRGDNIVTAACEFPANVYPWLNLSEQGVETRFATLENGRLTLERIAEQIDGRTRLVSISFVEFGTGQRNDVATIARMAHNVGALCAVDAIQGLGALRLDATAANLDFVSGGSAKWLLSPAHLGLLYVRPELLPALRVARRGWRSVETPFDFFDYEQPLRADAGRLEGGSNNWLGLISLGAALNLIEAAGPAQIEARALGMADMTRAALRARGFEVTSPDATQERSPVVLFRWGGGQDDAAAVVQRLATASKVVISERNGLMRVSPDFYNTEDDIRRFIVGLEAARASV